MALNALGWTPPQRHAVIAAFCGWTLDAFDFFVLTFVTSDLAKTFDVKISAIALAVTLTLAVRPLGAFLFGRLADDYGRKPVLMINILLYSVFGFATAFAPSLTVFLIIRALFGVAMGGIWGIGASLAFESIPSRARGFVSGLLQSGYPVRLSGGFAWCLACIHVSLRLARHVHGGAAAGPAAGGLYLAGSVGVAGLGAACHPQSRRGI